MKFRLMSQIPIISILACISISSLVAESSWNKLPPLPDKHGFAGSFAGVSHGCLLVAGGANFPDAPPWEGGIKVWSDRVFVLESPDGPWKAAGKLPGPRGYGVSVTTNDGMLCISGSDSERHHTDCFLLKWVDGKLKTEPYPPLPLALAESSGALLGRTIHVVGGTRVPGATTAEKVHLMLDLDAPEKGWRQEVFPGPARILAVSAVQSGAYFVMSGATLSTDADGNAKRSYLTDAWRYDSATGWKPVPDMPRAALAAPSPAPTSGTRRFLIIGGDDGSRSGFRPVSAHPGFSGSILGYNTATQTWTEEGLIPASLPAPVTTSTTIWKNRTVIPSGEIRPAIRTPEVTALTTSP